MIRLFLLSLFLTSLTLGAAPFDPLEKERLLKQLPSDTSKVILLIQLGEYFGSIDQEKALVYLHEAYLLSTELEYKKGIAGSFLFQGRVYYYKDEYDIALRYLEQARKLFEEIGDDDGLANYRFAVGSVYSLLGNYNKAIENFQEMHMLSKQTGNKKLQSTSLISLGTLHIERSEPVLALSYLMTALGIVEELNDKGAKALILSGMGSAYASMHDYDSALLCLKQSFSIRSQLQDSRGMASSEYTIADIYLQMGLLDDALHSLYAAKKNYTSLNEQTGVCISILKTAQTLEKAGSKNEALSEACMALDLAMEMKNPLLIHNCYETLSQISASTGKYEDAYQYLLMSAGIKDSLSIINNEKVFRESEMKFQTARKNDEIEILKSRNAIQRKQNLLLTISVIAVMAILLLLYFLFKLKTKALKKQEMLNDQEKINNLQKAEIQRREQQYLEEQLESKNRELASKALEMLRINETLGDVIEKLEQQYLKNKDQNELSIQIKSIIAGLEAQLKNSTWNEFEKIFRNIHSEFFQKLLAVCPDLTPSEIKTAAFLKLNLSSKEIAAISFKSEAGIKSTRYRLRQKLGLHSDDNLVPFLMQL
ncbi:MAG: tetratricopeptide repeat protein [Bacteroidales bacterium]|nr:tetratricopeptide repeat protein [Bacteroidales bacterium]